MSNPYVNVPLNASGGGGAGISSGLPPSDHSMSERSFHTDIHQLQQPASVHSRPEGITYVPKILHCSILNSPKSLHYACYYAPIGVIILYLVPMHDNKIFKLLKQYKRQCYSYSCSTNTILQVCNIKI